MHGEIQHGGEGGAVQAMRDGEEAKDRQRAGLSYFIDLRRLQCASIAIRRWTHHIRK